MLGLKQDSPLAGPNKSIAVGKTSEVAARVGAAQWRPTKDNALLSDRDLKNIEREHSDGLTSMQVVDIFVQKEIRFSEATFRKYVQLGILPRSRRVGRKGKHQGSLGLYPVATVRRINVIKGLMAQNYTIEDIQKHFRRFREDYESIEQGIREIFAHFETTIEASQIQGHAKRTFRQEVVVLKTIADDLLAKIEQLERRISEPKENSTIRNTPFGAEDLL